MTEASFLDPSPFEDFPQFHPSDLSFSDPSLFPDGDFPLPDGITADLDLDDIDLDFSIDDLLLPSAGEGEDGSGSNANSHLTTESNSNSNSNCNSNSNSNPGSPESGNSSASSVVAAQQEEERNPRPKRKIEDDDRNGTPNPNPNPSPNSSPSSNPSARDHKIRRSDEVNSPSNFTVGNDDDEKRKTRLMRNRESAQLSRQRKKHYVEELEEKVKIMNSTIADLNGKISFYMAENARLHHQLNGNGGNGGGKGNGNGSPAVYPPPPTPPPYHFPWIPYAGFAMRPNGHPVPYVPIPRLKPQQPAPAPKAKKSESKKSEGRTKKVASVSLFGLLLIMMLFGGVINFGLGGNRDKVYGGIGESKGRVLSVKGRGSSLNNTEEFGRFSSKVDSDNSGGKKKYQNESGTKQNSSETLPALLYVPRNGKHVEINGNLIIHSVLASERAMAQANSEEHGKQSSEKDGTSLAIPGHIVSALAVPKGAREIGRNSKGCRNSAEHPRALASDSHDKYKDNIKSTIVDGPLQQWFREGLAGPILSSGTCTEVFQFEVSPSAVNPSGGIVPATSAVNTTEELPAGKIKNRRILYGPPIPLNGSTLNNNTASFGKPAENSKTFHGNNSVPSMVVSVLADPREAGDGDGDGMIRPKSLSRIFVVVLMDSVKYVTYSCVLPLKSHGPHLVN